MKKRNAVFLVICLFFIGMSFVSAEKYENINADALWSCGNGMLTDIPALVPKVISAIYISVQIAVPVVLVISGSLDLFKGLTTSKQEDIKKGQQMFVKRLVAAALVFFVLVFTKVLISAVADGTGTDILECTQCFVENDCDPNV